MSKTSKPTNKNLNSSALNLQEKLRDAVNSVSEQTQNQSHNVKKESLGPNTKR